MEAPESLVRAWVPGVGAANAPSTVGPQYSAEHALCAGRLQHLPVSSVQLWLDTPTLPEPIARLLPHRGAQGQEEAQASRNTTGSHFRSNATAINFLFLGWPRSNANAINVLFLGWPRSNATAINVLCLDWPCTATVSSVQHPLAMQGVWGDAMALPLLPTRGGN